MATSVSHWLPLPLARTIWNAHLLSWTFNRAVLVGGKICYWLGLNPGVEPSWYTCRLDKQFEVRIVVIDSWKQIICCFLLQSPEFQFQLEHHLATKITLYDMVIDPTQKLLATACQDRNVRWEEYRVWQFSSKLLCSSSLSLSSLTSSSYGIIGIIIYVRPIAGREVSWQFLFRGLYFQLIFLQICLHRYISMCSHYKRLLLPFFHNILPCNTLCGVSRFLKMCLRNDSLLFCTTLRRHFCCIKFFLNSWREK